MATAELLDGRRWSVEKRGRTSLTRRYLVRRESAPTGDSSEEAATYNGLPAIGSSHPEDSNLVVKGYDIEEGTGADKKMVLVTVRYEAADQEFNGGSATTAAEAVESWGWHSGSVGRDLTHDVDTGKQVLNTFGDPFDSVPQVDRPSPVFTKVVKHKSRQGGWMALIDCVNDSSVTIGSMSCAAGTLRVVQVDEERLIGDEYGFKYRYTIGLQYLSNKVKLEGSDSETEIGWDVAVVNQGCRGMIKDEDGNFNPGRFTDDDSEGNKVPVSLPVLMDADSKRIEGTNPSPYMMRIRAYKSASIPGSFYSEPISA